MNTDTDNLSRFNLRRYTQPKVERGFYLATIDDLGVGPSRYGTPMLVISAKLDGNNGPAAKYLWRVPITEEDIHKLTQVHKALNLPTPSLPRLLSGEDTLDGTSYLGEKILIHLAPEMYQGKWRSIIAEIRPVLQAKAFRASITTEESSL